MKKEEFLNKLRIKLSNLPKEDLEERINFYSEMIDDRIEDGFKEEEAINDIGTLDEVSRQVIANYPLKKLIKEKVTPKKKINIATIILLVLGSPIWLSLLIAVIVVLFSLYVVLASLLISLWAVFIALVAGGLGGIVLGVIYIFQGSGALLLGGSIICLGLGILLFFGCKELTKLFMVFSKNIVVWIKNLFLKEVK
ncbi:MAG: DUF1700 domain-containing protein [Erysipelotrichaceae bacterium]|nr:DUF1700 domain-containing protein [Erysipelotrichaceae bacterium]